MPAFHGCVYELSETQKLNVNVKLCKDLILKKIFVLRIFWTLLIHLMNYVWLILTSKNLYSNTVSITKMDLKNQLNYGDHQVEVLVIYCTKMKLYVTDIFVIFWRLYSACAKMQLYCKLYPKNAGDLEFSHNLWLDL